MFTLPEKPIETCDQRCDRDGLEVRWKYLQSKKGQKDVKADLKFDWWLQRLRRYEGCYKECVRDEERGHQTSLF